MQVVTPETGRNYGPLHEGVMHDNALRMLTLAWVSIAMATHTMGLATCAPGALLNAAGCEARCSSYFCCSRRAPLQAGSRLPGTP